MFSPSLQSDSYLGAITLVIRLIYKACAILLLTSGLYNAQAQNISYSSVYDNASFNALTIDVNRTVGSTPGSTDVSSSGGSTYSIPIALPPGTNGIAPSIALAYSSQSGNGMAGMGWNIAGLSSITRVSRSMYFDNETNAVEMNANDRFILDGSRLISKSGTYGSAGATYGTESENFATITSNSSQGNGPEWFEVVTKEGVVMEFGNTPDSRLTGQNATVLTWALNKIKYPDGNYIELIYKTNVYFNLLIDQINYTGNSAAGLSPYNQVTFDYKIRQDINTLYQADTKIESKYLLDKITVKTEGQTVKAYQLDYGTDNSYGSSYGSYLKSLTESDANGSTLNATNFKYGDTPANFTPVQAQLSNPDGIINLIGDFNGDGVSDVLTADHNPYQPNPGNSPVFYFSTQFRINVLNVATSQPDDYSPSALHFLPGSTMLINRDVVNAYNTFTASDFTGDGADDILIAKLNQSSPNPTLNFFRLYKSIPNPNWTTNGQPAVSFDSVTINAPGGSSLIHTSGNFLFPGDFDGDGIQDLLGLFGNNSSGAYSAFLYYSQPGGTLSSFGTIGTSGSLHFSFSQWAGMDKILVLDFNGDGKSDLMLIKNGECEIVTLDAGYYARQLYYNASSSYLTSNCLIYTGDFNGDQKTDLLSRNNATNVWNVLISTGSLFKETSFSYAQSPNTAANTGDHLTVADFNGDGKSDINHAWQVQNVIGQVEQDTYYGIGYNDSPSATSFMRVHQAFGGTLGSPQPMVGDANGDGRADLINFRDIYNPMDIFYFRKEGTENLLSNVKNGFGHELRFSYKKLTDMGSFYTQGSLTAYPLLTMQLPMYAVSEQSGQNGIGGFATTQYAYAGLRLHRAGKGFLGFTTISASNLATGIKTVSTNEFNTTFYTAAPYQTTTYLIVNPSNFLTQSTQTNEWVNQGSKRFWYRVNSSSTNNLFEGRTTTTSSNYDSDGNVLTNTITTSNAYNNSTVETTTTTTTYGAYVTSIKNKPTQTTVAKTRSGQSTYSITTDFAYNGLGQLTSKTDFSGQAQNVVTTFGYNSLGNLTSTNVTPNSMAVRSSSSSYDSKGRFATATANVLSQTTTATYDARWGKPLTVTGIDGLTTSYQYDTWGRTTQTTMPENYNISQSWGWDFSNGAIYYSYVQHPGKPDVKTWMDVLGREIIKQTEGYSGNWITQSKSYDSRGNVASSTQPYLSGEAVLTTTTAYDDYNRPISVSNQAVGTATISYAYANGNLTTTSTNPASQVSTKVTDAIGQTIQATDNGGTLTYTYNSQGNLLSITQGAATPTTHEYDAYGRQTKLIDQNAGTTTYSYNAAGELISQTNANSVTHTMDYDLMGRVTSRGGSGTEGTTTTEYYPAGSAAVNQIKKITGFAGNITEFTYDGYGRLSTSTETIDGTAYTTTYGYNTYGDVTTKSYPSGFGTNHNYDGNGYLTSITNSNNSITLYSLSSQNGLGQPTTYSLGNGKSSTNSYYFGIPTSYVTSGIQNLNLTWDYPSGNLMQRQDGIQSKTESFTYDNLNRLKTTSVSGGYSLATNYNSSGNITDKTDAGTYSYLATKPNAIEQVTNTALVIPKAQQDISYTAFLQPQSISESNNVLNYTYGADYERIKGVFLTNNSVVRTRYYAGDGYEKTVTSTSTKEVHYIDSPAGLIAIVVRENGNDTYHYVYTDHIGSILTITNSSGTVEVVQNFDAWGRRRHPTTWSYDNVNLGAIPDWLYRGYTGHEHLDPFVLINMNGRIYDPVVGRVLSPDNFVQDPFSTQGFNRYTYALNNPLKYNDPDGNFVFLPFLVGIGAAIIEGAFISGAVYAINATITGQSLGGMGQALLWGGLTAGFANGIGAVAATIGDATYQAGFQVAAHGLVGGVSTWAQGGNFGSGFLTSAVGSLVGTATRTLGGGVQIGSSALVGGVVAELSGGSFLQGAVQAGIVAGFNHFMHRSLQDPPTKKGQKANSNAKNSVEEPFETKYSWGDLWNLSGPALIFAGSETLSKPFLMEDVKSVQTSIASKFFRNMPGSKITLRKITLGYVPRLFGTGTLGAAAGRAVPYVGWGLTAYDVARIANNNFVNLPAFQRQQIMRYQRFF